MAIIGMSRPNVMNRMDESEFEFHLTGSRFCGDASDHSDWDFFVSNSGRDVEGFLVALGFKFDDYAEYADSACYRIYKHYGENVHVQVIKDDYLQAKIFANVFIKHWQKSYGFGSTKALRRTMWDIAMAAWKEHEGE